MANTERFEKVDIDNLVYGMFYQPEKFMRKNDMKRPRKIKKRDVSRS